VVELPMPALADDDVSQAFLRAGCERCLLDLRRAPRGPVAEWLAEAHSHFQVNTWYLGARESTDPISLSRSFDAVFFLHRVTASRPNPPLPR
jgi:hypothetical protein